MKNLIILLLISYLSVSYGKPSKNPDKEWVMFWTSPDGKETHKCRRIDYLEFQERLLCDKPNRRIDLNSYYAFESDYRKWFIRPIKSRARDGQLQYSKDKKDV